MVFGENCHQVRFTVHSRSSSFSMSQVRTKLVLHEFIRAVVCCEIYFVWYLLVTNADHNLLIIVCNLSVDG